MGWEPIEQSGFAKWHAEALVRAHAAVPGTYELIGPKINGNPEGVEEHELIRHGEDEIEVTVYEGVGPSPVDLIHMCRTMTAGRLGLASP